LIKFEDYIKTVCAKLELSTKVENDAIEIAKIVKEKEYLTGRHPMTVAGVCIYFVT